MRLLSFILFATIFQLSVQASAQKHEFRISGELSHPVHALSVSGFPGYDYFDAHGLEFGYYYGISDDWQLGLSGMYQWNTYYTKIDEKYDCNESGVGLLLKNTFARFKNDRWNLLWTFGTYNGVVNNPEPYKNDEGAWVPGEPIAEGEKFFSDLYLDLEVKARMGKLGNASLAPFMKYRIKEHWLNDQFEGFQFGWKLAYSIGF